MFIPGHLAVGYLAATATARLRNRPPRLRTEVLPALLGAVTPDIVDKSAQLLGLYSRPFSTGFAWPLMTPTDWEFRFDSTLLPDLHGVTVLEIMAVALAAALAVRMRWAGSASKASS